MKTDAEVIQTRDIAELIKRPHLWPLREVLPVVQWSNDRTMVRSGLILKTDAGQPLITIYEVNLFTVIKDADQQPGKLMTSYPVANVYNTAEEAAADGWE
jgi:hypothetical protein